MPKDSPALTIYGSVVLTVSGPNLTLAIDGEVLATVPGLSGALDVTGSAVFTTNASQKSLDLVVKGDATLAPIGKLASLSGNVHFNMNGSTPEIYGALVVTVNAAQLPVPKLVLSGTVFVEFNTTSVVHAVALPGQPTVNVPAQSAMLYIVNAKVGVTDVFSVQGGPLRPVRHQHRGPTARRRPSWTWPSTRTYRSARTPRR